MKISKRDSTIRRHRRIRSRITGTADRPRVCISRSNRHLYGQVIDDEAGKTLVGVSTVSADASGKNCCNAATATALGKQLGGKLKELNIDRVVFDRGGHVYHGVIKAFADGLRAADEENHFNF